jgi:hypothetical protein
MARKSISELLNDLLTSFPDNNAKFITPAILRQYFTDFLNAIRPAYGLLIRSTGVSQAVTVAPAPLVFTLSDVTAGLGEFTGNATIGELARNIPGTVRLTFSADLLPASNATRTVTYTIYKNGVPTVWRQSVTTSATGVTESVSFVALIYADAAASYQMYVSVDVAQSYTFSQMVWVAEVVPVNSYT